MREYREKTEVMGIPVLQIPRQNHPECPVDKVTDTDIEEVETSIAKPDHDAFNIGSTSHICQIPIQGKIDSECKN